MKKLLFLALIIGVAAALAQKAKADKETWLGLSEDEARERLEQRLPSKIPEDRREHIKDTMVTKMRERGVLTVDEIDVDELDLTADADISEVAADAP